MAFPAGVETVTVSSGEPLTTPSGELIRGHIRFVAPPLMVVPSDNYTLGGEAVAELVDGEFTIVLVAGDATDIDPSGWTYAVFGEFTNAADWTSQIFLVKANPSVVLADVLQPDASLPNYFTEKLPLTGGTMTGDIVLAGDPTAALHPATKQYTDAGDDARVAVAGDTMTGPLVLPGNPVSALQAAPKQYVDTQAAAAQAAAIAASAAESVSLAGDAMSGLLLLSGNPAAALGAAPKQYVDTQAAAAQSAAAAESVSLAGDTMTGPLVLSGGPSVDLHPSTKKYTDDQDDLKLTLAGGDTITGPTALTDGFDISVPNITELLGALVSTGVIKGGSLDPNPSFPTTKIDVNPVVGYIVDHVADPDNPVVKRIETSSIITHDCANLSSPVVWYSLSQAGVVVESTTQPTAEQYNTHLQLGFSVQLSNQIVDVQTLQGRITASVYSDIALINAIGAFSVRGEEVQVSANGANLRLNHTTGKVFSRGLGLYTGPVLNHDRDIFQYVAANAINFRRVTQLASSFGAPVNVIDPGMYDVNGVLTAVPNPTSTSTILRVFTIPLSSADDQFYVQYGQATYSTLNNAIAAVGSDNFVINPLLKFSTLIMYIAVTKIATNLSDPAQAQFRVADRFQLR